MQVKGLPDHGTSFPLSPLAENSFWLEETFLPKHPVLKGVEEESFVFISFHLLLPHQFSNTLPRKATIFGGFTHLNPLMVFTTPVLIHPPECIIGLCIFEQHHFGEMVLISSERQKEENSLCQIYCIFCELRCSLNAIKLSSKILISQQHCIFMID